jgi:glyoxylate reductase
MARIFSTYPLPGDAFLRLGAQHDLRVFSEGRAPLPQEIIDGSQEADILLCLLTDRIDPQIIDACPSLRLIANYAVGVNNIHLDWATMRGIPVLHTPHVLTDASADHAFALILAVARRVVEGDKLVRERLWDGWDPTYLLGSHVTGKTLGILGMGRIGQALARRARGFEMPILYNNTTRLPAGLERELGATYLPLEELLEKSDILSIHCPLTPKTTHLLDEKKLRRMKKGAILINTARGAIVDESALVRMLQAGHLRGAGLDVFAQEPEVHPALIEMSQVVLTPHIGSGTEETRAAMTAILVAGIEAYLAGEIPSNVANPEIWTAKEELARQGGAEASSASTLLDGEEQGEE